MNTKLQKISKLAEILDISDQRAYALAREDFFPPGIIVRIGRQVRFNEDALIEWISQGGSIQMQEGKRGESNEA